MVSTSKTMSNKGTERSIKTIPCNGLEPTKGAFMPCKFCMKAQVFAAVKGLRKAMMEDRWVKEEWTDKGKSTDDEVATIQKQNTDP
jgi:hypothetical protein